MSSIKEIIDSANKASKKTIGGIGIERPDPGRIPFGIFPLDLALGGGVPIGRGIVIGGIEGAMKSTLLAKLIASHQREYPHKQNVYIDVEGVMTQTWAEAHGVDWSKLAYVIPTSAEQVVDLLEGFLAADDVGIVGVDSVAAMITQRELEHEAEVANVGGSGLVMGKLYRKVNHHLSDAVFGKSEADLPTLVLINQIRYKIGVMYGDPETMPGGKPTQYLSSLTLRLSATDEFEKKGDKLPWAKTVRVTIKKNKIPILSKHCECVIALRDIPEKGLKLGDCYDWTSALAYMKSLGMLEKVPDGWKYNSITYPTQDKLHERYMTDLTFKKGLQQNIIGRAFLEGDPFVEES